jgi:cytochrome c-type biogenesis protein CcmH/NrfG
MGASRQAAAVWRELGDLYRDLGRAEIAMDAYDRALRAVRIAPVTIDVVPAGRIETSAGQREGDMASM